MGMMWLSILLLMLAVIFWLAACEMGKYAQELRREQARLLGERDRLRGEIEARSRI